MVGAAVRDDDDAVPVGTVIDGEYRVDGVLGQGGMGVVHRAFDLRLERAVAVKVHRGRGLALERLAREATALARLAHPNVVAVHRVGSHDGRVYVAMELVDGGTARAWAKTPRAWREVLRLYAAAGDGLVAAHVAGLVHRDFKPDNVLVGADGRPRVADFGLARAAGGDQMAEGAAPSASSGASPLLTESGAPTARSDDSRTADAEVSVAGGAGAYLAHGARTPADDRPAFDRTLTVTGGRVGTPAFMAPEQLDGAVVDARADQFAFAVSIWEALHGRRPFRGETTTELRAAIARGELDRQRRPGVPRWLDGVLGRALRERPAERWPDVAAMLAALRDGRRGRRPRWAVAAAAVAVAVAVATATVVVVASGGDQAPWSPTAGPTRRLTSIAERKQDPVYIDERTIAFVANDPATGQYDVWLADRDGGGRRRLTATPEDEYLPRPWPGGGLIVSRWDGERSSAWRLAAGGEAAHLVDDASYASVAPSGEAIAFIRNRGLEGGAAALWVHPLTGGADRELLALPAGGVATAWSPDGRTIAAADPHQVWVVDVASGRGRRLGEPAMNIRSLAWEPRGRALVADGAWAGRSTAWWLPLAGTARPLGTRDNAYNPVVSPGGDALLFVVEDKRTFLVRSGGGGAPERLPLSTALDCIDVDHAGRRVAASDWEAGHGDDELAVIQALDGSERRVLGAGRCPRFSPDGSRVAFLGPGAAQPLMIVAMAGGAAPRALDGLAATAIPAWMPDGRVAVAGRWGETAGLWLVDVDGRAPPRRVTGDELTSLSPSPDGRTIAASVADGTVLVDVGSGAVRRLTHHHAFESPVLWRDGSAAVEVLVDERLTPALLTIGVDGVEGARRLVPTLTDAGFWGTFWVRRLPGDGLLALQIRYDNDVYEAPLR